jgi:hypothetical protein
LQGDCPACTLQVEHPPLFANRPPFLALRQHTTPILGQDTGPSFLKPISLNLKPFFRGTDLESGHFLFSAICYLFLSQSLIIVCTLRAGTPSVHKTKELTLLNFISDWCDCFLPILEHLTTGFTFVFDKDQPGRTGELPCVLKQNLSFSWVSYVLLGNSSDLRVSYIYQQK